MPWEQGILAGVGGPGHTWDHFAGPIFPSLPQSSTVPWLSMTAWFRPSCCCLWGTGCPVEWKMPCPGGCASKGCSLLCVVVVSTPEQRGVRQPVPRSAPRGAEREPWPVPSPGRCSLLLLKSQPKGSAFAQLLVASSGLLLLSHDSAWHVREPVLEKEQEGLACWVICNA